MEQKLPSVYCNRALCRRWGRWWTRIQVVPCADLLSTPHPLAPSEWCRTGYQLITERGKCHHASLLQALTLVTVTHASNHFKTIHSHFNLDMKQNTDTPTHASNHFKTIHSHFNPWNKTDWKEREAIKKKKLNHVKYNYAVFEKGLSSVHNI